MIFEIIFWSEFYIRPESGILYFSCVSISVWMHVSILKWSLGENLSIFFECSIKFPRDNPFSAYDFFIFAIHSDTPLHKFLSLEVAVGRHSISAYHYFTYIQISESSLSIWCLISDFQNLLLTVNYK